MAERKTKPKSALSSVGKALDDQESIVRLGNTVTKLRTDVEQQAKEAEELGLSVEAFTRCLADFTEEFRKADADQAEQIDQLQKQVLAADEEVTSLRNQITDAKASFQILIENWKQQGVELSTLKAQVNAIRTDVNDDRSRLSRYCGTAIGLTHRLDDIESRLNRPNIFRRAWSRVWNFLVPKQEQPEEPACPS